MKYTIKKNSLIFLILTIFTSNSFALNCQLEEKGIITASKKIKKLYNFVFSEYFELCKENSIKKINVCSIPEQKIRTLNINQKKLNKIIDYTYERSIWVYQKCNSKNGFKEMNKIRNFDNKLLNENIYKCINKIVEMRNLKCPI